MLFDGTSLDGWSVVDGKPIEEVVRINTANKSLVFVQHATIYFSLGTPPQDLVISASFRCPTGTVGHLFPRSNRCVGLGGGASGSLFAYEGRAFVPLPGRPASFQTGNGKRFQVVPAAVSADHPTGGWNNVEVMCNKLVWLVKVNGKTVNQANATEIEPWAPCLRAFSGFEIRNMRIRDLSR